MRRRINSFGRRELIVGLLPSVSDRNKSQKSKVTLMARGYCSLTRGENLRNTGLPKGCETQGNGVPVVVDKKNQGGQLILAKNICAVKNGGINALQQLADSHFLTVTNIYQIIYCKELLIAEYGATKSKAGNLTPGSDRETYDGMNHKIVDNLITELKSETYKPAPTRRLTIRKGNGKTRPLGIPSAMDKLVQGIVSKVLVAIYEKTFNKCSHGYRPSRGAHTAMKSVQSWNGIT